MGQSAPNGRAVYVIDDDVDLRKSLHFLLATASIRVWPFACATDFIEHLPHLDPAPILLDVRMADMDGLKLLEILKERGVTWPIVVMTAHGDITTAVQAMKLGAIEFLEKPFDPQSLQGILDQAFALVEDTQTRLAARLDARRLIDQLSRREWQTITILMRGALNKVAAHELGLSPRTVEMHRGNALAKLGLKSMAEVVALFALAEVPTAHHDPDVHVT
jgi:two-component system response regulator FixJ